MSVKTGELNAPKILGDILLEIGIEQVEFKMTNLAPTDGKKITIYVSPEQNYRINEVFKRKYGPLIPTTQGKDE